jgi:peptidoglycan/xylan/chitin deacetylase (PgdA/CDA1 family)
MLRISISFDYDSPAGYRESFHMRDFPGNADYEGAGILMSVLRKHDVKATFGIVGQAALPGEPPDHCQEQIRAIHAAGHEIASHSMHHRFIPPMRDEQLIEDLTASKNALESCSGARVVGFIPPFNRPSHFPGGGAFSISEWLGLDRRGRGRQSVGSMLRNLDVAGYDWSGVSFQSKFDQVGRRLGITAERPPMQPFVYNKVVAIPLHQTGFGIPARNLVRRWLKSDCTLTVYGHPNQALSANGQNAKELDGFLAEFRAEREAGTIEFNTMGEIAAFARASCAELEHGPLGFKKRRVTCKAS